MIIYFNKKKNIKCGVFIVLILSFMNFRFFIEENKLVGIIVGIVFVEDLDIGDMNGKI